VSASNDLLDLKALFLLQPGAGGDCGK
jgi:hypothetical protein